MTPVEPSSTCSGAMPSASAAHSAVFRHSSSPVLPVAALAMPAFTTTACAIFFPSTIRRSQITGAACTRLLVNVPATAQGVAL